MAAMPVPAKYTLVAGGHAGRPAVQRGPGLRARRRRLRGGRDVRRRLRPRRERHKLIDAIERSSATGRSVKLD